MKLEPCPNLLCDNKDIGLIELVKEHSNNEDLYYYQCVVCGCVSPKESSTRAEAIAAWNTRPIETKLRAELEALKQWQREALPYLKNYHSLVVQADFFPNRKLQQASNELATLIKQAEGDGNGSDS